jgi:hypothetical protein
MFVLRKLLVAAVLGSCALGLAWAGPTAPPFLPGTDGGLFTHVKKGGSFRPQVRPLRPFSSKKPFVGDISKPPPGIAIKRPSIKDKTKPAGKLKKNCGMQTYLCRTSCSGKKNSYCVQRCLRQSGCS